MRSDPRCAGGRAGTRTLVPLAIGEHLGLSGVGVGFVSLPLSQSLDGSISAEIRWLLG